MTQHNVRQQERAMDVTRASVISLLIAARKQINDNHGNQAEVWWDGYIRAIEHVLEMDGQ